MRRGFFSGIDETIKKISSIKNKMDEYLWKTLRMTCFQL